VDDKATGTLTDRPWRDGTAMVTAAAIPSSEAQLSYPSWTNSDGRSIILMQRRAIDSRRGATPSAGLLRVSRTSSFVAFAPYRALLFPRASAHKSPARSRVKPASATAYCAPVSLPSRQTTRQIRNRAISARKHQLASRGARVFRGKVSFFSRFPPPPALERGRIYSRRLMTLFADDKIARRIQAAILNLIIPFGGKCESRVIGELYDNARGFLELLRPPPPLHLSLRNSRINGDKINRTQTVSRIRCNALSELLRDKHDEWKCEEMRGNTRAVFSVSLEHRVHYDFLIRQHNAINMRSVRTDKCLLLYIRLHAVSRRINPSNIVS